MFDLLISHAPISNKKALEIKDNNNNINVLYWKWDNAIPMYQYRSMFGMLERGMEVAMLSRAKI